MLDEVVSLVQDKVHAHRGHPHAASPAHSTHVPECAGEASLCVQVGQRTLPLHKSMRSLSLPPKVWQWMRESAAMTRMMPGAAEVMPEVSPVPLLQRRSASEARWHEPVSTSRDCARKAFGNVRFCNYLKCKEPFALPCRWVWAALGG